MITIKRLEDNKGIPILLLWMMAIISGLSVANIYYAQPLLNQMNSELHVSEFAINMVPMITQVGYACGLLIIVPMGDMYSRRNILLCSFVILSITLCAVSFVHSLPLLLFLSAIIGMFSVIPQVFIPMVSQYSIPPLKSRNMGIVLSGLLLGILSSRVVSGIVGEYYGWRVMYILATALMICCILLIWCYLPSMAANFSGTFRSLLSSLLTISSSYPMMKWYAVRAGCCFGAFLAMWSSLVFHVIGLGYSNDVVGLLGICGMAGALTASAAGGLIHRYGASRFHIWGGGLMFIAWCILIAGQNDLVGIIVGIILLDVGMQTVQLSNQSTVLGLVPNASSRSNTIFMTIFFIFGALGTFLSGIGWHYMHWYGVGIVGCILISISLLITYIKRI